MWVVHGDLDELEFEDMFGGECDECGTPVPPGDILCGPCATMEDDDLEPM